MTTSDDALRQEDREISRGYDAEGLLANPLLVAAIENVRGKHMAAWKNSKPEDAAGRERAWMAVAILEEIVGDLTKHIQTRKLAEKSKADRHYRERLAQ